MYTLQLMKPLKGNKKVGSPLAPPPPTNVKHIIHFSMYMCLDSLPMHKVKREFEIEMSILDDPIFILLH